MDRLLAHVAAVEIKRVHKLSSTEADGCKGVDIRAMQGRRYSELSYITAYNRITGSRQD